MIFRNILSMTTNSRKNKKKSRILLINKSKLLVLNCNVIKQLITKTLQLFVVVLVLARRHWIKQYKLIYKFIFILLSIEKLYNTEQLHLKEESGTHT